MLKEIIMRVIITMLLLIGCVLLCGCSTRSNPWGNEREPSTDWIIAQYHNQDEVTVTKRRIVEGW